jgi:hypothetical protein
MNAQKKKFFKVDDPVKILSHPYRTYNNKPYTSQAKSLAWSSQLIGIIWDYSRSLLKHRIWRVNLKSKEEAEEKERETLTANVTREHEAYH